mmetsp:Transcript_34868/g.86728  ORF Transcript_34868/g.86728 Transcript_34868/m.86728 type:complete len:324 (-) Transcript_34868:287-1258(-)
MRAGTSSDHRQHSAAPYHRRPPDGRARRQHRAVAAWRAVLLVRDGVPELHRAHRVDPSVPMPRHLPAVRRVRLPHGPRAPRLLLRRPRQLVLRGRRAAGAHAASRRVLPPQGGLQPADGRVRAVDQPAVRGVRDADAPRRLPQRHLPGRRLGGAGRPFPRGAAISFPAGARCGGSLHLSRRRRGIRGVRRVVERPPRQGGEARRPLLQRGGLAVDADAHPVEQRGARALQAKRLVLLALRPHVLLLQGWCGRARDGRVAPACELDGHEDRLEPAQAVELVGACHTIAEQLRVHGASLEGECGSDRVRLHRRLVELCCRPPEEP